MATNGERTRALVNRLTEVMIREFSDLTPPECMTALMIVQHVSIEASIASLPQMPNGSKHEPEVFKKFNPPN